MSLKMKVFHSQQKGFSLIEVMVSLLVISFGLMALTNLQTRSVTNSTDAYIETQSMLFLKEMIEHLRIDKEAAVNGGYNIALSKFSDLSQGGATATFAENKRYRWFDNMNKAIPGVKASINCDNAFLCVVEVRRELSGKVRKHALAVVL